MLALLIIYLLGGLAIGSFVNVVIVRLKTAESFVFGNSHCPKCKAKIKWYDLIPVVSFLILQGRCRNCQEKISWQYPTVELTSALFFGIGYLVYGLTYTSVLAAVLLDLLLIIVVYDLREMEVPESVSWIALALAFLGRLILSPNSFGSIILGGLIGGGVIGLLVFLSKGKWMGDGDIKIGLTIGFFLGFPVAVFGTFLAFILGAILGVILIGLKIKKGKDQLPFTPFMLAAMIIAIVWGQRIVDWYLGKYIF